MTIASVLKTVALVIVIAVGSARASWLSDITGININVPRGTVTIGAPNPAAIPQMLQNLPKDAAMFFLNPVGSGLALAIRHAKEQARYGCRPIPPAVSTDMRRFYPENVLSSVCWTTYDPNRIALDGLLLNSMSNVGAITLEDVIVFRDGTGSQQSVLWGHELTHVLQYRNLGVEAFANLYSYNFNSVEAEAYRMQDLIANALQNDPGDQPRFLVNNGFGQAIPTQIYAQSTRQALPPIEFCGASYLSSTPQGQPVTVAPNNCPVAIRIVSIRAQNMVTGEETDHGCVTPRCVIPPGGSSFFEDQDGTIRPKTFTVAWAQ